MLVGYEPLVAWEDGIAPTFAYLRSLRSDGPSAASRTLTSGRVSSKSVTMGETPKPPVQPVVAPGLDRSLRVQAG